MLRGENATPRVAAKFSIAVVQSGLLYRSKTWNLMFPLPHRLKDGTDTQTLQRFVWVVEIPLDKGCARGMRPSLRGGLHRHVPFYDHDVCGRLAPIQ